MPVLDVERIKEDANAILVAESIGLNVYYRNGKHLIFCPEHNDKSLGSCFISARGYICYSCHAHGNVIDLVRKVKGCKFIEACEIIAETCGGLEQYVAEDDGKFKRTDKSRYLSDDECALIGIQNAPVKVLTHITESYEEMKEMQREGIYSVDMDEESGQYYLLKTVETNPLYRLFLDDQETYFELVAAHCHETLRGYEKLYEKLCDPTAWDMDFAKNVSILCRQIDKNELTDACQSIISRVKSILRKATGFKEEKESRLENTSVSMLAMIANAKWHKEKAPF